LEENESKRQRGRSLLPSRKQNSNLYGVDPAKYVNVVVIASIHKEFSSSIIAPCYIASLTHSAEVNIKSIIESASLCSLRFYII
tara:strand:+ start:183 stop:434 length:252 start_codon:yes stop_codon:yes gene_type:complete